MLNKIDKLSKTEFTEVFGNIFENASWIGGKLYEEKPFNSFEDLSNKMLKIFEKTSDANKLLILKSHPDLADKAKIGSLTKDSNDEQSGAGLDKCSEDEFNKFNKLNEEYKKKFEFPFILAVTGKNKNEILDNFKKRILNNKKSEFFEANEQVKKIALTRLAKIKNNEKFH